ncbi:MAG: homocysteine S-methyltransferase family protein [Desulfobacterales bacterium]
MNFQKALNAHDFILMEAAIIESLMRAGKIELHPQLLNALLIYDPTGRTELTRFFDDYIAIANRAGVPVLICTSTWRANRERVAEAGVKIDVNADAVAFLKTVRERWAESGVPIYIGGLMGPKNDAYAPAEGLAAAEAKDFHAWQAEKLANAGPDFLMAATMPALSEAEGMAAAMAQTRIPYIISFVISRQGLILDGTGLADAFFQIDQSVSPKPAGYMVNCAYPSFLNPESQPASVFSRLIGFQANASSMDHSELNNADYVQADPVSDWGDRMVALNRDFGVKILGGCCGTGRAHLDYIGEHI